MNEICLFFLIILCFSLSFENQSIKNICLTFKQNCTCSTSWKNTILPKKSFAVLFFCLSLYLDSFL